MAIKSRHIVWKPRGPIIGTLEVFDYLYTRVAIVRGSSAGSALRGEWVVGPSAAGDAVEPEVDALLDAVLFALPGPRVNDPPGA